MKIALHYMAQAKGDVLAARELAEQDHNHDAVQSLDDMDTCTAQYNRYLISSGTADRIRNLHQIAMGKTSAAVSACKLLIVLEAELRNASHDEREIADFFKDIGIEL